MGRRKFAEIMDRQAEERGEYGGNGGHRGNFLELGKKSFDGVFFVNAVLKGKMGSVGELRGLLEIVEFRSSMDDASHTVNVLG